MSTKMITITLSLLAVMILASVLALRIVKDSLDPKSKPSTAPDSFVTNVTYTKMDEKGAVQVVFFTPHVENYQARDYVEFQKPDIKLNNAQGAPWHITANKGTSDNKGSVIDLIDNVKLQQTSQSKSGDLLITTSAAVVHFEEKYAATDKPVTITQGEFTINAVGANADLNKGIINLVSNVREIYVPVSGTSAKNLL
jgi:lipopolysaccharide export system protein LptC